MSKTYNNGPKLYELFFRGWKNGFRKISSKMQQYPDDTVIADAFQAALSPFPLYADNAAAYAALGAGKLWKDAYGVVRLTAENVSSEIPLYADNAAAYAALGAGKLWTDGTGAVKLTIKPGE